MLYKRHPCTTSTSHIPSTPSHLHNTHTLATSFRIICTSGSYRNPAGDTKLAGNSTKLLEDHVGVVTSEPTRFGSVDR
ncbi:hypothetical protein HanXRQr2_Chr14g0642021 [Helianthus annuus]|uniref:Uncharacterized protein n=1 Tax=Helianthus annuus TaxID=4232 RepID=A0A251SGR8_HELAN|nr:hypothetical protein HanXRQr2_Chr14g0642021 [Helianthus annuus]KAJ0840200.1 hypothetical protein HanPSC8_Chr14g0615841 [Helianthus annuus]